MSNIPNVSTQQSVKRIGIILGDLGKLNTSVLKYLVLQINTLQQTFEFEFLPADPDDEFLRMLSNQATGYRNEIKEAAPEFLDRYRVSLEEKINSLMDKEIPRFLIVVTLARFDDNYYSARKRDISVLTLGNWDHWMAPPSIVEFILTLVIREAIGFVCPSLRGSIHLGTKGCVCDFTPSLSDARIKVLSGFICHYCRATLEAAGFDQLPDELVHILKKDWLGKSTNPYAPAGIASNLGYDLFITKGLTTTRWERIRNLLTEEVLRQFISTIAAITTGILIAYLLIRFGLKQ